MTTPMTSPVLRVAGNPVLQFEMANNRICDVIHTSLPIKGRFDDGLFQGVVGAAVFQVAPPQPAFDNGNQAVYGFIGR